MISFFFYSIDHFKIPLIMIIVGGEKDSFEIAMSNLEKKVPVVVIDGSGSAADFISKGYRMSTHKKWLVDHNDLFVIILDIIRRQYISFVCTFCMYLSFKLYGTTKVEYTSKLSIEVNKRHPYIYSLLTMLD